MARALAFAALLCWVILLYPYPTVVFLASCTALLSYPMFCKYQAVFKRPLVAVGAFTVSLFVIIVTPIVLFIALVAPQGVAGVRMFNEIRKNNWQLPEALENTINSIQEFVFQIPGVEDWYISAIAQINESMDSLFKVVISGGFSFAGSAANYIWLIFLFFILTILALSFGPLLKNITLRLSGFETDMLERFILSIRDALRGVVLGILLVAVLQGLLAGIGFSFAGIPQPAFWGLLVFMFSPIPVVGTAIVWVPMSFYLWLNGNLPAAIGLFAWCFVVVTSVDNFLRPLFLKTGIAAPMFVLMIGILCGLAMFGVVGLIAGPVLIAFSIRAMLESNRLLGMPVMTSILPKKTSKVSIKRKK